MFRTKEERKDGLGGWGVEKRSFGVLRGRRKRRAENEVKGGMRGVWGVGTRERKTGRRILWALKIKEAGGL